MSRFGERKKLTFVETWLSYCKTFLELGVAHVDITHVSKLQLCSALTTVGRVHEGLKTGTAGVVTFQDCQVLLVYGVLWQLRKNRCL